MASEMVDRVARILWADMDDRPFDSIGPETQERMHRRAQLVLMAMREPTSAMAYDGEVEAYDDVAEVWRRMIDVALAD